MPSQRADQSYHDPKSIAITKTGGPFLTLQKVWILECRVYVREEKVYGGSCCDAGAKRRERDGQRPACSRGLACRLLIVREDLQV